MKKLTGTERKYLRGQAHGLKPVVMVGQNGVTETLVGAVDGALDDHELIKVKFVDFKDVKKELAAEIEKKTDSELVGMIGNVAIFYREHKKEEKRKVKTKAEE